MYNVKCLRTDTRNFLMSTVPASVDCTGCCTAYRTAGFAVPVTT